MLAAANLFLQHRIGGVSLNLRQGEVTAICGPNGAGKSSLLSLLAGIFRPDRGELLIDGAALGSLAPDERARRIGYLPQHGEAAWDISVETLAGLGRLPWNLGRAADTLAVDRAIADMQLEELRARPLSRLSGGERARAMLARVLAGEPCWLLADEPLANLDLRHQLALLTHFRSLAAKGLGVVLVLHDLAQAMNRADRVVVLKDGLIMTDAAPQAALDPAVIARVWGVEARWLGEEGQRALVA